MNKKEKSVEELVDKLWKHSEEANSKAAGFMKFINILEDFYDEAFSHGYCSTEQASVNENATSPAALFGFREEECNDAFDMMSEEVNGRAFITQVEICRIIDKLFDKRMAILMTMTVFSKMKPVDFETN